MRGVAAMVPDGLRAGLRSTLVREGIPGHAVDEIVDLATLAISDAFDAINRVVGRSSSEELRLTAFSVTIGTAIALLQTHSEVLQQAARESGMRVTEGTVSIGAGQ